MRDQIKMICLSRKTSCIVRKYFAPEAEALSRQTHERMEPREWMVYVLTSASTMHNILLSAIASYAI